MFRNPKNYKNKISIFKILSLSLIFILLGFGVNIYSIVNYQNVTNEFYSSFNNSEFQKAKNIIDNKNIILYLKNNKLKKDLQAYFTDIVTEVCSSLKSGEISSNQAILLLNEIKKYDIMNSSIDKLLIVLNDNTLANNQIDSDNTSNPSSNSEITEEVHINSDNSSLSLGITALNSKNYSNAIQYFKSVPKKPVDDYNTAQNYILKCQNLYKDSLIEKSDELVANKYYTKAIELLSNSDSSIIDKNDKTILDKINFIQMVKEEYLSTIENEDSEYTSTAILQNISINNVNTLNIDSKTPYFIYLNLEEQKTYIYKGAKNNWELLKSFSCSTGLPGKETPKGVFSITGRGDWFFSKEFMQGGKYWVQFMGDYLFHSVPFAEDKTTVLDKTLGVPASHGCVRLALEDSKWLYDNINNDTKLIIN